VPPSALSAALAARVSASTDPGGGRAFVPPPSDGMLSPHPATTTNPIHHKVDILNMLFPEHRKPLRDEHYAANRDRLASCDRAVPEVFPRCSGGCTGSGSTKKYQMSKTRDVSAAWNIAKRQVVREHPWPAGSFVCFIDLR
jgi:hypothetical protein